MANALTPEERARARRDVLGVIVALAAAMRDPGALENPFFRLFPTPWLMP
ncbi:MAG: hypothetical protein JO090_09055, partial [Rhizobacter sp.]|nr:hypothetical protein [Rhizobacter sp.]